MLDFSVLKGKTLTEIKTEAHDDAITFYTSDNKVYRLYHHQDCCEEVWIEDINGDLNDLIGYPLTMAELDTNSDDPPSVSGNESYTWSFYKLATVKGYVTIRWFGGSNGYYSEEVSFKELK